MTQLLRKLSEKYTRILILGPPAAHALEVEMLATYADSVIVALSRTEKATHGAARDCLQALGAARSRLSAVVVC
jgi:hypothetical protein